MDAKGLETFDEIGVFSGISDFHQLNQSVSFHSPTSGMKSGDGDGDRNAVKNAGDDLENTACMEVLVCGLQIASHLARNDESYFPRLMHVFCDPTKLQWILSTVFRFACSCMSGDCVCTELQRNCSS